jgi:hypothetical protein
VPTVALFDHLSHLDDHRDVPFLDTALSLIKTLIQILIGSTTGSAHRQRIIIVEFGRFDVVGHMVLSTFIFSYQDCMSPINIPWFSLGSSSFRPSRIITIVSIVLGS